MRCLISKCPDNSHISQPVNTSVHITCILHKQLSSHPVNTNIKTVEIATNYRWLATRPPGVCGMYHPVSECWLEISVVHRCSFSLTLRVQCAAQHLHCVTSGFQHSPP